MPFLPPNQQRQSTEGSLGIAMRQKHKVAGETSWRVFCCMQGRQQQG